MPPDKFVYLLFLNHCSMNSKFTTEDVLKSCPHTVSKQVRVIRNDTIELFIQYALISSHYKCQPNGLGRVFSGDLIFLNGQSPWRMCGGHPQQQIVTVMEILHFWGPSFGGVLVFLNGQNPSPMADMLKKESSWLGRQHYTSEWVFAVFFWEG